MAIVGSAMRDEFIPTFGLGEENEAFADHFVGKSYLNPLANDDVVLTNVTFEPGCRNDWHIHHGGYQILICTDGQGWYQEWHGVAQKLTPGAVVVIPPNVKHWHGAADDSWFSHIAVTAANVDIETEWLEPVDQKVYEGLWASFAGLERF